MADDPALLHRIIEGNTNPAQRAAGGTARYEERWSVAAYLELVERAIQQNTAQVSRLAAAAERLADHFDPPPPPDDWTPEPSPPSLVICNACGASGVRLLPSGLLSEHRTSHGNLCPNGELPF